MNFDKTVQLKWRSS